jgi:hypothetical protein
MKKLTNWDLCKEIIVYSQSIGRMIEDVELIKAEAAKLKMTDELRKEIAKVINIYDNELTKIKTSKWENFSPKGERYFYRTFKKGYLLNFQERMNRDLTALSDYQNSLLKALDFIHKEQTKATNNIDGIIEIIMESGRINLSQIEKVGEVLEELENRGLYPYVTADRDYIKLQDL